MKVGEAAAPPTPPEGFLTVCARSQQLRACFSCRIYGKQRNKAFQTVRLWKQEHRARPDIPDENEKTAISRGFEKCATDGT